MRKSHNLGSRNESSKLNWQVPVLIDLAREEKRASGDCEADGSGDYSCWSIGLVAIHCSPTGSAAA